MKISFLVKRWKLRPGGAEVAMLRLAAALRELGHTTYLHHLYPTAKRSYGQTISWNRKAAYDVVVCAAGVEDQYLSGAYKVVRAVHSQITPQWMIGDNKRTDGVIWASRALSHPVNVPSVVSWPIIDKGKVQTKPGNAVTLVNPIPEKGGDLILEVARQLLHIPFLFIEGGWWRSRQADVSDAPSNLTMIPYQTNSRDIYNKTRVLLYPGPWDSGEGWMYGVGMTALEASCSGIPVIASPGPGLLESMGGFAKFVPEHTPEAWAEAIEQVYTHEWNEWSEKTWQRSKDLNPAHEAQTVAELLEVVCA